MVLHVAFLSHFSYLFENVDMRSIVCRGGTGTRRLPVPAGYCTTPHYLDPAGYYFKI